MLESLRLMLFGPKCCFCETRTRRPFLHFWLDHGDVFNANTQTPWAAWKGGSGQGTGEGSGTDEDRLR